MDVEMTNKSGSQLASTSEAIPLGQQQQQEQIIIPVINSRALPPPNLPLPNLIDGPREEYNKIGVPLYEASIRCDWSAAKAILYRHSPELLRSSITENGETALHIAASAKTSKHVETFVKNLVELMTNEDLELQNKNNNTAFFIAAAAGNIKAVKIMMRRNIALLTIPGSAQMMPLYAAALFGNYEVVKYLYDYSNDLLDDGWNNQNREWLLQKCVEADMFDVALKIVKKYPKLDSRSVLGILARKPDAFSQTKTNIIRRSITSCKHIYLYCTSSRASENESEALQLLKTIWEDIAKRPKTEIDTILRGLADRVVDPVPDPAVDLVGSQSNTMPHQYSSRIMFIAAEMGNTIFLVELIRRYPDLMWKVNDDNQTIFHIAVKYRHEGIYNLLYEIGSMKDLITPLRDADDNNMLHLTGKEAAEELLEDVSGPALKMQRELLWFKEVRNMIPPSYRERKNRDGLTPRELFSNEHTELIKEGEKWMKDTASQCMVVATLIATIVFAAAFTVPGGYGQDDGIPIFYRKQIFIAFVVADAMSLFLSSASILTFLSILTSRYAKRDFEETLPKKLMIGVSTLFLSITAMMITFSISFFILYHKEMKWIPILISVFAVVPISLYVVLQYHVLADVIRSTYGSRYLFKPRRQVLYYVNPRV